VAGLLGSKGSVAGNWLVTLFNLNYRSSSTPASALSVVSLLDTILMLLLGLLVASMYPTLSKGSKAWAAIAVALPFLGVVVFLTTATAGRSAALLAGLISSILALRARFGGQGPAITGIAASTLLLFVGDFGTAALPPSTLLASLIALGYVLWAVWLLFVTLELVRQARVAAA
jgi:hypothetical protein